MTLSSAIAFVKALPFSAFFARRTSKNALSLFEQAQVKLKESSEIALSVVAKREAQIAKFQKEADEMRKLAETNETVIKNIDTNILGKES